MSNPRACLMLQATGEGRLLVWRIREGQHPSRTRKILAEWSAATMTRDEAISAARTWGVSNGYRIIINESWLTPA